MYHVPQEKKAIKESTIEVSERKVRAKKSDYVEVIIKDLQNDKIIVHTRVALLADC